MSRQIPDTLAEVWGTAGIIGEAVLSRILVNTALPEVHTGRFIRVREILRAVL
jgi:hypothetical protein